MNSDRTTTSNRTTPIGALALLFAGFGWLAMDIFFVTRNVVLRETRLVVIANFLDRLPAKVGNPIFIFLWIIFLFGWAALIGIGGRKLLRRRT